MSGLAVLPCWNRRSRRSTRAISMACSHPSSFCPRRCSMSCCGPPRICGEATAAIRASSRSRWRPRALPTGEKSRGCRSSLRYRSTTTRASATPTRRQLLQVPLHRARRELLVAEERGALIADLYRLASRRAPGRPARAAAVIKVTFTWTAGTVVAIASPSPTAGTRPADPGRFTAGKTERADLEGALGSVRRSTRRSPISSP